MDLFSVGIIWSPPRASAIRAWPFRHSTPRSGRDTAENYRVRHQPQFVVRDGLRLEDDSGESAFEVLEYLGHPRRQGYPVASESTFAIRGCILGGTYILACSPGGIGIKEKESRCTKSQKTTSMNSHSLEDTCYMEPP
jgi:hypothetical protein